MPVALFWFLDFTTAIHDTSLFAALVVAFAYRQIFAGGVPGIKMVGQSAAVWKPFEAWVTQSVNRITTRNKLYADRFDDTVRSLIAGTPAKMAAFKTLMLAKSARRVQMMVDLATLTPTGDAEADTRIKLDMMWSDFRRSEPDLYGWLLYKRGIVGWWRRWMWLDNGRSKITLVVVLFIVAASLAGAFIWFSSGPAGSSRIENASLVYHRWRILKANVTERDRWRSRDYLVRKLRELGAAPIKTVGDADADVTRAAKELNAETAERDRQGKPTQEWKAADERVTTARRTFAATSVDRDRASEIDGLSRALLSELEYPSIPAAQAAAIFRLIVDARSPALNAVLIPPLIDSLRGQNEVVRLETRKTLVALQRADYPKAVLPDEVVKWEPKKDETAADIDQRVRRCHEWWRAARQAYPVTTTTGSPRA